MLSEIELSTAVDIVAIVSTCFNELCFYENNCNKLTSVNLNLYSRRLL